MKNPLSALPWIGRVVFSAGYRFYWDDCFSRAAGLSYTTLFALVPITALSFSMFGLFGIEQDQLGPTLATVLEQVMPGVQTAELQEFHHQVLANLTKFSSHVSGLNTISLLVLIATGIALLNTIESALNVIWRVSSDRSIASKVVNFWAVITLGPALIALSIYCTTKIRLNPLFDTYWFAFSSSMLPVVVSTLALCLLFFKMPAANVKFRDALFGGFVAAVLFEMVKVAFAYYLTMTATYSKLYGVVAAIPLFLFWMYITWVVVLFGSEIAYQSGSVKILSGRRKYATDLGEVGAILGLRILLYIGQRFVAGEKPPSESEISIQTGSDPELVRTVLALLVDARLLTAADSKDGSYGLAVSPSKLKLGEVFRCFRARKRRDSEDPETAEDLRFLDMFHHASQSLGREKIPSDWTLKEFITAS